MSEAFSIPPSWQWVGRPPMLLETGLRGHAVLVLYWRLGCVHSRVALHEAAMLVDELFGMPVALLAVHVPTCAEERDVKRLVRTIAHLPGCLTHAIATDRGELNQLPTTLLVDGEGIIRVRAVGALRRDKLRAAIEQVCREKSKGRTQVAVPFVPSALLPRRTIMPLAVAADGEHVWVASGAHRSVFACDGEGKVVQRVGSGRYGSDDGARDAASFAWPASLCVHEEYLAVVDAHSHTVRAIDRATGEVLTWSGTGWFGSDDIGGGYGCDQALSSPMGVVSRDGGLYVCMAGTDQLWQIDPMTGSAMAWLGGDAIGYAAEERSQDQFSEPLALAASDELLWVAEGRGRTLSKVDLAHVARHSLDLKFVRPAAVVVHDDRVFVADSWQGKVFVVSTETNECAEFLTQEHGLGEPVSLAIDGTRLLIADVGADAILTCDLAVTPPVVVPMPLQLPAAGAVDAGSAPTAVVTESCQLREHSDVRLRIPTPGSDNGTVAAVDVVDEATPLLACDRREVTEVQDGHVTVLLPVADSGRGCLRVRLRVADVVENYVVPATVTVAGSLEATLVLRS